MFKGTNKTWKALALVLALCMLSTVVVVADSAATLSSVTAAYNETNNIVTVSGTIDAKGNDVTVLAVRNAIAAGENGAGGISLGVATGGGASENLGETGADSASWSTTTLQNQVVYIDQAASNAETGAFSFEFIPRTAVSGGTITVFVGGANVAAPVTYSIAAPVKAPDVNAPAVWYQGTNDLVMTISKAGDAAAAYGDAAAITAWANKINSVKIKKTASDADWTTLETAGYSVDADDATFTLVGLATDNKNGSLYALEITTENGDYSTETWAAGDAPLTQTAKTPGTLTNVTTAVVAGTTAPISVDTTKTTDVATWTGAINASTYYGADAASATTPTTASYADGTITVGVDLVDKSKLEETITVKIAQDYYVDATATVAVVAPTKAAIDKLTLASPTYSSTTLYTGDQAYIDANAAGDLADMTPEEIADAFGYASITLPGTIDGATVTWTMDGVDATADTAINLPRAASTEENPDTTVEFIASIASDAGYATATKTFTVTVNQIGNAAKVAPENVALTATAFGIEGAKVATITLEKGTIDPATQNIIVEGTTTTTFLYAPERSTAAHGVDVFVAILRDTNTDATAVANAATIGAEASENVYYGKVGYTTSSEALAGSDAAAAKRLNKDSSTGWTDAQFIAFDVYGTGEVSGAHAACIVRANKSGTKEQFSVIESVAE